MILVICIFLLKCLSKLSFVACEVRGEYECGEHGRFEYCIDEIPGCVIGCHCHPGYYFDTETKICEPNIKLIENRRLLNVEKQTNDVIPIASTSKIDSEVDGISKDAEDLGDWLYKQFFKTIENQVINKTSDKNIITRRSNLPVPDKKPKRKNFKKKKGDLQRSKKTKLKKKLLRISENDSIFDVSDSHSDSGSTSDSSSDSSFEYSRYHDNDDEHGHRKIVMIKKKPKRPLPNFIFLPNMGTPYYPPIGLPPPPVVPPMYPMVPVPPLIPYLSDDDSSEKTTIVSNATTTTYKTPKNEVTNGPTASTSSLLTNTSPPPTTPPSIPQAKKNVLRHPNRKRKNEHHKYLNDPRFNDMIAPKQQQKFIQYLKQKMKNHPPDSMAPNDLNDSNIKLLNTFIQDSNFESQFPNNAILADLYLHNNPQRKKKDDNSENVDFKYMTELIHRVDLNNKSNDLPPIEYNPLNSLEAYQPPLMNQDRPTELFFPPNAPDTRRSMRPRYQQSDDSYYTQLGRQIASMIRGVNTQDKDINIKVETSNDIPKNDLVINSHSPGSYWERFVRSPLTFLKANKKRFEYLKRSNELLFDIENKVEIIASTTPTLTLQEIENIVKVIEKTKENTKKNAEKKKTLRELKPHFNPINVNLWPQEIVKEKNISNSIDSISQNNLKKRIKNHDNFEAPHHSYTIPKNIESLSMLKINRFAVRQKIQNPLEKQSKIKPIPYTAVDQMNYYKHPQFRRFNIKPTEKSPLQRNLRQPSMEKKANPLVLNYKKYFESDNDHFLKTAGFFSNSQSKTRRQPSYFPHDISFGDYFFENQQ